MGADAALLAAALTLLPAASVPGPRVSLGQIARIEGAPDARLAALDVAAAPLPGYTLRLTRAQIERLLRARAHNASVGGSATVAVERLSQAVDSGAAVAAAETALRAHLAGAARLELRLAAPLAPLEVPAGRLNYQARALPRAPLAQRRVTVWVDVLVDALFVRSVAVPFDVQAFGPVLAARHDLAAGAAPGCAALAVREADLAALGEAPAAPDCQAVQGRLALPLAQGAVLLKRHLTARLAVAQGDNVALRVRAGAIAIETRATALADAGIGQQVEVRTAGATHPVRAEVSGPGLVTLTQ